MPKDDNRPRSPERILGQDGKPIGTRARRRTWWPSWREGWAYYLVGGATFIAAIAELWP